MAWFRKHPKQRPDEPIEARTLREVAETADVVSQVQAEPPLSVVATAGGYLLRYAGQLFGAYLCESSSTITARSGATPGSGTATIQKVTVSGSPAAPTAISASAIPDIKVYNWNSASGGITSGKYMVVLKLFGFYWVIAAEC